MTSEEAPAAASRALDALRAEFFARWVDHFPEDGSTLGLRALSGRLRDPSEAGDANACSTMRDALARLTAIDRTALDPARALDADVIERHARFTLSRLEDELQGATSLELSILPHAAVAFQLFQVRGPDDLSALEARLAEIPSYLATRAVRRADALRAGHRVDRVTASMFAEDLLPGAAAFTGRLAAGLAARGLAVPTGLASAARAASDAFAAHGRFFAEELVPTAGDAYALGPERYAARVASFFGAPLDQGELCARARDALAAAQSEIVARAREVARKAGGDVRDLPDAAQVFFAQWSAHPKQSPFDLYEATTRRIVRALAERDVVTVPDACTLHMVSIPDGIAVGAQSTNWPVPLRDPAGRGLLLVNPDARAHSLPGTMNLAIHEGIPGHYLQSFRWREIFATDAAPVRSLLVTDDVAMAHEDFWAMPHIEGWAVRMEELCLDAGVHDVEEALLGAVAKAIRALRVLGDVGLHTGHLDRAAVAALMHDEACMPESWGRGQATRYGRIGVQAITYAVGARHIAELETTARTAWGPAFSRRGFHDWLLGFGPVPPARLHGAARAHGEALRRGRPASASD